MQTDCAEVVTKYAAMVYRLALCCCRNVADAEDVTQDVFVKYWRHSGEFPAEAQRKAWLVKVTVSTSRDMLRAPWRSRCCALEEIPEAAAMEPADRALLRAVMSLAPKYRSAVHLYYYEGYSVEEIAGMVGASPSAVRMRLLRARQKLKDELKGDEDDGQS